MVQSSLPSLVGSSTPPRPTAVAAALSVVPAAEPKDWGEQRRQAWQRLCPSWDPGCGAVNAEHWADIELALETIQGHPLFASVLIEKPLPVKHVSTKSPASGAFSSTMTLHDDIASVADGSHIVPFDSDTYTSAMATRGLYTCGGNLLWTSAFFTPFPTVPINRRAVCH